MSAPSYHAPTLPTLTVTDAIQIAYAGDREIHDMGFPNSSDARERAAERLAEVVEDLQARLNHIIFSAANDTDDAPVDYREHIRQLAQGIAPEATARGLRRAS